MYLRRIRSGEPDCRFARESGDDVRRLRERLTAAGVREVEWAEMDGFVSIKFEDPDGYVVEVFWEE